MTRSPKPRAVRAWAWTIRDANGRWGLCFWAEPSRTAAMLYSKPSPEARLIRVEIRPAPKRRKKARRKA